MKVRIIMTTVQTVTVNTEVKKLLNKANNAAKNASHAAVLAADMAVSLCGIKDATERMNAIKKAYQVLLAGMAGSVKETFAARVTVQCFPTAKVEIKLNKTELKERLKANPKSAVTTKTIDATEATTRHDLNAAAKQVRESLNIPTKQTTKAGKVSKLNMDEFKTSLNIVLTDKALTNQFKEMLKEHGYSLRKASAVKPAGKIAALVAGNKGVIAKLEQNKSSSTVHTID